jgi:hypothetical protein
MASTPSWADLISSATGQPVHPTPEDGPIWTTRDGRRLAIRFMEDQHLLNVKRFLDNKHCEVQWIEPPCFQGEMAQMAAEAEWLNLVCSDVAEFWPVYNDILDELRRRKLLPSST